MIEHGNKLKKLENEDTNSYIKRVRDYLQHENSTGNRSISRDSKYSKMKRYNEKISRASNLTKNSKSNSPNLNKIRDLNIQHEAASMRTPLGPISNKIGLNSSRRGTSSKKSGKKKKKRRAQKGKKNSQGKSKWPPSKLKPETSYTSILSSTKSRGAKSKTKAKPKSQTDYNNLRLLKKRSTFTTSHSKRDSFNQSKKSFSPLSTRTSPKFSISKKPETGQQNFEAYFKIGPKTISIISTVKDSEFLYNTGKQVSIVTHSIKRNEETYEKIRVYADLAQEFEFDILEDLFSDKDAKRLCSRVLKFERWTIILIFYFEIVKKKNQKLMMMLKGMIENVWKNQCYLVCWLKKLVDKHDLDWNLGESLGQLYPKLDMDSDSLIVKIVNCCQLITGYLIKV